MHPIENMLQTTMSELKQMVDVNTVVGTPFVTPHGATIIPISKVSFGFVSGGGEYQQNMVPRQKTEEPCNYPFAGGSASGISIKPIAFLVVDQNNIKVLAADNKCVLDKILQYVPQMMQEIKDMFGYDEMEADENQEETDESAAEL